MYFCVLCLPGMAAGTSLGKIRATDADEGTNQDVEFSLVTPNAHPGLFDVQANGKVSLLMDLTETYGTALSLEVMAKDKGLPSRSSTTVITLDWVGCFGTWRTAFTRVVYQLGDLCLDYHTILFLFLFLCLFCCCCLVGECVCVCVWGGGGVGLVVIAVCLFACFCCCC